MKAAVLTAGCKRCGKQLVTIEITEDEASKARGVTLGRRLECPRCKARHEVMVRFEGKKILVGLRLLPEEKKTPPPEEEFP